jgi:hypothetical protein
LEALDAFAELSPDPAARDWRGVSFTRFCRELGLTLDPGQLALTLVAYDGLEPQDLPAELRAIARQIFGPVDVIPAAARRVLALVAGGRGGKSYIVGAIRVLHLALTVSLATLAAGEQAFALIFSGDPRQRQQCFRYVHGAAMKHPGIRSMIRGRALDEDFRGSEFTLHRRDGKVTIESLPPKVGGGSGRGRSLVCALLEEAAFFQDENHQVNDVEVFKAVIPRVLPGGQTILSSTPWAEAGVLYEEFIANHPEPQCAAPHLTTRGRPHRAIAAHAPTLLLFNSELTRTIVEAETVRDPGNARREYGAQFMPLGAVQFFDAAALAEAVDETLLLGRAPRERGALRCLGIDLGFVHDSASGVPVERTPEGYAPLAILAMKPGLQRLKPSETIGSLLELAETYNIEDVIGDQHHVETAREHVTDDGRRFIDLPGGAVGKSQVFDCVRLLFAEKLIKLPNEVGFLQQLREVKRRPLPGGGWAIEQPRSRKGGHGDDVSAFVAAVWFLSTQTLPVDAERPATPKWERALAEIDAAKRPKPGGGSGIWDQIGKRVRRR